MKTLVVTADATITNGVAAAFPDQNGIDLTSVETVPAAINRLANTRKGGGQFDFVVLEFDLPGLSGLKGVNHLSDLHDRRPFALLMRGGSLELAQRAYRAGANAVISKDLPANEMSHALELARQGQFLCLFTDLVHNPAAISLVQLSERELQILRGLCDGLQNKEIAHAFSIQEVTVKMHMRAVVRKLGAKNRTHAAMIARDLNLV
ncbi:response regulator transcription factor [Aliiroseovarius lamellibrachiae]|uniref:response regulator transcription factor n=1 Tax=Aliiroseovarius lamellibrachiae TaxID=1924933 RepID=UPI001BDFF774|nr:response regulator transcription factor [Aliiroseovarius lamellibrachiae]MBT2130545.1 response regulator transcription factor [Aliiroseovarius lamellibrachiae]